MNAAPRVGIVGLGAMGWRMAKRLHGKGWRPRGFDVNSAVVARFDQEFSGAVPDLVSLGELSDVVITMLPNGKVVNEVLCGEGGVASALKKGSVIIDMSSSDATGTAQLAGNLAALGFPLVDAPVSGGQGGAETGQLTIMVGADDEAAVARVLPVLSDLGSKIFRTGRSGSGHAAKAINNFMAAAHNLSATEGLLMGRRFGLSPEMMLQILNVSSGRSAVTEVVFPNQIISRKFANGFSLGLMAKDTALAAALARSMDMETPLCQLIERVWADANATQGSDVDFTEIFRFMEKRNGLAP